MVWLCRLCHHPIRSKDERIAFSANMIDDALAVSLIDSASCAELKTCNSPYIHKHSCYSKLRAEVRRLASTAAKQTHATVLHPGFD
jgi:hypothetical protein